MKNLTISAPSLLATRTGACGYCSFHFSEIQFPATIDNPLFIGFVIYQLIKFVFHYSTERFNDKAHLFLTRMYWLFLLIVSWTCLNHLLYDLYYVNDVRIISEKSLICFGQIAMYLIFEWVAEFFYCVNNVQIVGDTNSFSTRVWSAIKEGFDNFMPFRKVSSKTDKFEESFVANPYNNREILANAASEEIGAQEILKRASSEKHKNTKVNNDRILRNIRKKYSIHKK